MSIHEPFERTTGGTRRRLMIVIGTRPEAIKLAPVILEAQRRPDEFEPVVVTTSQHRQMLDQMMGAFSIRVDRDLDIMKPDQDLSHVTSAALTGIFNLIGEVEPDVVVVQGDTSTTLAGALAAFYHQVPVAHVEAGLRTYNKLHPFPEEINRVLCTHLTDYHFAPTNWSSDNLRREGIPADQIWVTGNTAIDALFYVLDRQATETTPADRGDRTVLMTAHRRENHGEPLERICRAAIRILAAFPDVRLYYPVHPSPRVRETVFSMLADRPRIELIEPLDYFEFVRAMNHAHLILTDSGGVQEEAPSLGKPVLVLRDTTERPEGVEAGTARLVGTVEERIFSEAARLLESNNAYREMARIANPYGDGTASKRILDVLADTNPKPKRGGLMPTYT